MKSIVTTLIVSLSLGLVACDKAAEPKKADSTKPTSTAATTGTAVNSKLPANAPIYKVATISSFIPFEYRDDKGNSIGFDVDLLKAIGEKQGFGVNYLVVPWDGILETLGKGTHDIVSSAVVITPERQQMVDFSDSYLETGRAALVADKLKGKSFKDLLADKTLKYMIIKGSRSGDILKSLGVPPENIINTSTQFLAIQGVIKGQVDAAFDDALVMQYYAKDNASLNVIKYEEAKEQLGIAVKKGNTELLKKINTGLSQLKQDGTYNQIYKKWFGEVTAPAVSSSPASATK